MTVGIAPKDAHRRIAAVPADAGHAAIGVARPRTEGHVVDVQMLTGFLEVLQLVDEPLQDGNADVTSGLQVARRLVAELLVRLDCVANPNGVSAILGITIIRGGLHRPGPCQCTSRSRNAGCTGRRLAG